MTNTNDQLNELIAQLLELQAKSADLDAQQAKLRALLVSAIERADQLQANRSESQQKSATPGPTPD